MALINDPINQGWTNLFSSWAKFKRKTELWGAKKGKEINSRKTETEKYTTW
jgi:hypothetical protein